MIKPTDGYVYFAYGATTAPYSPSNPHAGVDYTARTGDNIYAPHSGKVVLSEAALGPCGQAIDIEGGRYKSRLCHNSQRLVGVGTQVNEGQVVAKAGASGNATGPHCHWVLWVDGVRVDPVKYLGVTKGTEDMPTPKQVGDIYKALTGYDITQKDLDFYVSGGRTTADLVYGLLPGVQKLRDEKKLLETERDTKLYPAVEQLNQLLKTDPVKKIEEIRAISTQLQQTLNN